MKNMFFLFYDFLQVFPIKKKIPYQKPFMNSKGEIFSYFFYCRRIFSELARQDKPSEPAKCSKPAKPEKTMFFSTRTGTCWKPVDPCKPAKSERNSGPSEPAIHSEPVEPAEFAKPEDPDKPAEPEIPEPLEPAIRSEPAEPVEFAKPEDRRKFAEPETPKPLEPAIRSEPVEPEEFPKPKELCKPAEPEIPEFSEPDICSDMVELAEFAKREESHKPAEPEKNPDPEILWEPNFAVLEMPHKSAEPSFGASELAHQAEPAINPLTIEDMFPHNYDSEAVSEAMKSTMEACMKFQEGFKDNNYVSEYDTVTEIALALWESRKLGYVSEINQHQHEAQNIRLEETMKTAWEPAERSEPVGMNLASSLAAWESAESSEPVGMNLSSSLAEWEPAESSEPAGVNSRENEENNDDIIDITEEFDRLMKPISHSPL